MCVYFNIDGQSVKAHKNHGKVAVVEEAANAPISPGNKATVAEPQHNDSVNERDEEESARILAEFKVSHSSCTFVVINFNKLR